MPATREAINWRGREMIDLHGQTLGRIEAIYLDYETDAPEWALVRYGRFGGRPTFVPLEGATADEETVHAHFDQAAVNEAPAVDPDEELSQDAEAALYRHYGMGEEARRKARSSEGAEAGEAAGPEAERRHPPAGAHRVDTPDRVAEPPSEPGAREQAADSLVTSSEGSSNGGPALGEAPVRPAVESGEEKGRKPDASAATARPGAPEPQADEPMARAEAATAPEPETGERRAVDPAPEPKATEAASVTAAEPKAAEPKPAEPKAAEPKPAEPMAAERNVAAPTAPARTARAKAAKPKAAAPEAAEATKVKAPKAEAAEKAAKPTAAAPRAAEATKVKAPKAEAAKKAAKPTTAPRAAEATKVKAPKAQGAKLKAVKPKSRDESATMIEPKAESEPAPAAEPRLATAAEPMATAAPAEPEVADLDARADAAPVTEPPTAEPLSQAATTQVEELDDELEEEHRRRLELTRDRYRIHAATYDFQTAATQPARDLAVDALDLSPGDVVLDVGCGTGGAFARIEERIGPEGKIIGVELSPDMLRHAQQHVRAAGWENVELVEAFAEELALEQQVDAVVFIFTHDILRSPRALRRVMRHLRPGGRVVATGVKWAPWWAPAVNSYMVAIATSYISSFEGFDQPWSQLACLVPDLEVRELSFGSGFLASGTRKTDG